MFGENSLPEIKLCSKNSKFDDFRIMPFVLVTSELLNKKNL